MRELAGARVLVVGASRGIGRAVGDAAAAAGARVAYVARDADDVATVADAAGDACVGIAADVADGDDCARLVATATDSLGGLDLLVYAAACLPLAPLDSTSAQEWSRVWDVNVRGAALVAAAAMPALTECSGRLVLLSSDAVDDPRAGLGAYAVSKAALNMLARCVRLEHPDVGVLLATVGPTVTTIASGWDRELAASYFATWSAAGQTGLTGRVLLPDEVATAVLDAAYRDTLPAEVTVAPEN